MKTYEDIKQMYLTKKALNDALLALQMENIKKIEASIDEIFNDLREDISKFDFLLTSFGHTEELSFSIHKNHNKYNKQKLTVEDINSSIDGEIDEDFKKVIRLTEKFMKEFTGNDVDYMKQGE